MALGFMINEFYVALLLDILYRTLAVLCLFYLARWLLKPKLEILFKDSLVFKAINRGVQRNPWKSLIFIKIMILPSPIKNYGLGITDVSVIKFLIVTVVVGLINGAIWIYFGSQMKSLNDVFNEKESDSYLWVKYSLITVTGIIIVILCFAGKRYFDEIKKEIESEERMDENKKLVNDDKTNNNNNNNNEYGTMK